MLISIWTKAVCLIALLTLSTFAIAVADDPIPAFPGAEGAGKYAAGGRGGEVYYVTNLSDFGFGSIRHAIESAFRPRTIVFDVSGIIYLSERITIRDKKNLTIAGQTAPGEGITIANHSVFVSHSEDIIIQNIRFAPGDGLTKPGTENDFGHISDGNPRGIRVWDSKNVILDNITARWGQEDNMGATHDSRNVTIQNAISAEGLHDADHFKGSRSYGVVAGTGEHFSYLTNLITQNRARNPRSGRSTLMEFSNNIIYHAGHRASDFTDFTVRINYIGNIGISGPNDDGPSHLVLGDSHARVFEQNNFYDRTSSQPFNLAGSSAPILGPPQRMSEPFFIETDYETLSLRDTYIHVLSRSGAAVRRDLHDKRAVKDVALRTGRHIDRPVNVGGYGNPESSEPQQSTSRDGIPDWWKLNHGLDINARYNETFADDGYTFLEHYLHSLMEPLRIPTGTEEIIITADELDSSDWPHISGHNTFHFLRFDASSIKPGSITNARLEIDGVESGIWLYTRDPMIAADQWDPGNSTIPTQMYRKNPWRLGSFAVNDVYDSPSLAAFLNNALLHYQSQADNDVITLIVTKNDLSFTKENQPKLVIQAIPKPQIKPTTLSHPEHGSNFSEGSVELEWIDADGADTYHLQVSEDAMFQSTIIDETGIESNYHALNGLESDKSYYWRVRAERDNEFSDWSVTWSFFVGAVTSAWNTDTPRTFELAQNYPNPFNPATKIRFALPETGHVTIEVYTLLGQRVATLVNDKLEAGHHFVTFDGSHLASGIYTYRMQAGNYVQTRKFSLVK